MKDFAFKRELTTSVIQNSIQFHKWFFIGEYIMCHLLNVI